MFILLKAYLSDEVIRQKKKRVLAGLLLLFALAAFLLWLTPNGQPPSSVAQAEPNATAIPTPPPTETPAPTHTAAPTETPVPTSTLPPTATPIPTVTPTNTPTPFPSPSATYTAQPALVTETAATAALFPTETSADEFTAGTSETVAGTRTALTGDEAEPQQTPDSTASENDERDSFSPDNEDLESVGGQSGTSGEQAESGLTPDEDDSPIAGGSTSDALTNNDLTQEAGDAEASTSKEVETSGPDQTTSPADESKTGDSDQSAESDGSQIIPPNNMPTTGDDRLSGVEAENLPDIASTPPPANQPNQLPANTLTETSWGMVGVTLGLILILVGAGVSGMNSRFVKRV